MSKAQPSADAVVEARVECLKAALELRTPGTSADAALAIAEQFARWVLPEPGKPEPKQRAENRDSSPGPLTD